jgi:hypothetical protein
MCIVSYINTLYIRVTLKARQCLEVKIIHLGVTIALLSILFMVLLNLGGFLDFAVVYSVLSRVVRCTVCLSYGLTPWLNP